MINPILYCGDTSLDSAGAYLGGVMTAAGWGFDYVSSIQPLRESQLNPAPKLLILSDYPADLVTPEMHERFVEAVHQGMGLLMIGGWESFHGAGGNWDKTPTGDLLGVEINSVDDRVNNWTPALLMPVAVEKEHPILISLPWDSHPPFVGGWNEVVVSTAQTLMTIQRFEGWHVGDDGTLTARLAESYPGLTVRQVGQGRVATFMSDVAPHWVGGLVDWGPQRIIAQAPRAAAIEVGNWYARFFQQLLNWTGQLEPSDAKHPGECTLQVDG